MERMGYKGQPYIVYKHFDIDREHIHITIRVDEKGRKISDSKDYERNLNICRELGIKYGLKRVSNKKEEESQYYFRK